MPPLAMQSLVIVVDQLFKAAIMIRLFCGPLAITENYRRKKARRSGLSILRMQSVVATHQAEQLQQADEQVVDRYIQADGRHDVVALAAVDDGAGLVQDADRREQYEAGTDRQLQAADLEAEDGENHTAQQH